MRKSWIDLLQNMQTRIALTMEHIPIGHRWKKVSKQVIAQLKRMLNDKISIYERKRIDEVRLGDVR